MSKAGCMREGRPLWSRSALRSLLVWKEGKVLLFLRPPGHLRTAHRHKSAFGCTTSLPPRTHINACRQFTLGPHDESCFPEDDIICNPFPDPPCKQLSPFCSPPSGFQVHVQEAFCAKAEIHQRVFLSDKTICLLFHPGYKINFPPVLFLCLC